MGQIDLVCCEEDCKREFYLKEADVEFYKRLNFDMPRRCWDCRQARKNEKRDKARAAVYQPADTVEEKRDSRTWGPDDVDKWMDYNDE